CSRLDGYHYAMDYW
nr:immunoglobulin heavy chain junction region [Mus musculus]MBK4188623.1 immunoglobulin heavy chain junction region [Mus musculus]